MRKLGTVLPLLLVLFFVLVPAPVEAANTTLIQIIPEECDCEGRAPDWGCVLETVRNLINTAIAFGAIVSVLIIAYAGALWMFSPFNPGNREKGRTLLLNAVIGLAVALGAWLIVDFMMKSLYNPEGTADNVELGPWNSILSGGERCVSVNTEAGNITAPDVPGIVTGGGLEGGDPGGPTTCPHSANGLCFQTAGIAGQYPHASAALVQLMTCVKGKVPEGHGQISSISHSSLVGQGDDRWDQCRASVVCQHGVNSCHFGGRNCRKGQPNPFVSGTTISSNVSFAVDYGDGGDDAVARSQELEAAAQECGGAINREGNHLHVSIRGQQCGCDAGL